MKLRFGIPIAVCLFAGGLAAQQTNPVREYPISNKGSLRLSMPESWKVDARAMPDPATVFLHISPAKGNDFDVQLTVVWLSPANLANTTPESIKANTERTGNGVLLQAVEKNLTLMELRGAQSVGTYYTLTDRKPDPGEFKYITQGSFLTGEVLSAFTILSGNPSSSDVKQLLRTMSDATFVKARAAAVSKSPNSAVAYYRPADAVNLH